MNDTVQLCAHLRRHGSGVRTVTIGNLSVELCKQCVRELDTRLSETQQPETPIEELASKSEVRMQQRCIYEVRKAPIVLCRVVCDRNETMCPRHIIIAEQEAIKKARLEHEREMKCKTPGAMKTNRRAA
jgi:hypothetical protein